MNQNIGIVGIGNMGTAIANRLIDEGNSVWARDINEDRYSYVKRARTDVKLKEISECELVLLSLPDNKEVKEVVLGDHERGLEGLLDYRGNIRRIINMSTISPEVEKDIYHQAKECGIQYMEAPVSGGPDIASKGKLTILAGGDEESFKANKALLKQLGKPFHVGPIGAAQAVKAASQILGGVALLGIAEAMLAGKKIQKEYGIDLKQVFELICETTSPTSAIDTHGPNIISGRFEDGFPVKYWHKDLRIACEFLGNLAAQASGARLIRDMFRELDAQGEELSNGAAIYRALSRSGKP